MESFADLVAQAEAEGQSCNSRKLKAFMRADSVRGVNIKALIEEGRA